MKPDTVEEKIAYLDEFLLNIDCLDELTPYIKRVNIFDILRATKSEIRHSNMLAWLLDAKGSHRLGDAFISRLLRNVIAENSDRLDIKKWSFIDYSTEEIHREWHKDKENSLDILITFNDSRNNDRYLIAIENKIESKEHVTGSKKLQTTSYKEILEQYYNDYNRIYIYLSPYGDEPEDSDWICITYATIKKILSDFIDKDKYDLDETSRIIINNYIDILGRDIMNDELVKLCNDIYQKYPKAFDIIFENRQDAGSEAAEKIRKALEELSNEDDTVIVYDKDFDSGNTYLRFGTTFIDELLGNSMESKIENDVWANDKRKYRRYFYEIKTRAKKVDSDAKIPMFLTVTKKNSEAEKIEAFIEKIDRKKKNSKANKVMRLDSQDKYFSDIMELDINVDEDIQKIKDAILEYVNKHRILLDK